MAKMSKETKRELLIPGRAVVITRPTTIEDRDLWVQPMDNFIGVNADGILKYFRISKVKDYTFEEELRDVKGQFVTRTYVTCELQGCNNPVTKTPFTFMEDWLTPISEEDILELEKNRAKKGVM